MDSHELANLLLSKPNVKLIKQTDDEGNGYTDVSGADFDVYVTQDDYEYVVWGSDEDPEELGLTQEEFEETLNKYAVIY